MKKFFKIVFIAVACCLTFASVLTLAACKCEHKYENGKCVKCGEWLTTEGVEYVFTDDGNAYGVAAFTSKEIAEAYILPEYNGKPVTIIFARAFANSNITRVTIPDSVTTIENEAFYNCDNLVSATTGNGVTSIGDEAFRDCDKLKNMVIGNGVTMIGKNAFSECDNLTSVIIPDSVTTIDDYAFWYCKSLTNVAMGNSVTHIGNKAFGECKNLTNITVPDSIISIRDEAFSGCNLEYNEYDNALYLGNNDNPCVVLVRAKNKNITACEINKKTKLIRDYAFRSCSNLKNIVIPDSVARIGYSVFEECTDLTKITISDSVTEIGGYAFRGCNNLKNIAIPVKVTSIGYRTFEGCTGLTNITISDSVTEIGDYAFKGCNNLKSVIIPDKVTSIGDSAFEGCTDLTNITISDSVTEIGNYVFKGCNNLKNVEIGNSVTSIGREAFFECNNLNYNKYDNALYLGGRKNSCVVLIKAKSKDIKTCIIEKRTKVIYDGAFENCIELTSIIIPFSVINIGWGAFAGCNRLEEVGYTGTEGQWDKIYNVGNNSCLISAKRNYIK